MALSDYERRVLAEIEVELRAEIAPRRRLRSVLVIVACLLVVGGCAVLCGLLLPAPAAAGVCAAAGLAAGFLVALDRERHRLS